MVNLLPIPEQQWTDANGNPLAGGTVATFIPGTTTPKTTWSDSAGAISNTQPVVLDSAGRCKIWGSGAYRFQIHDAAGNLIYDQNTADISDIPWTATATGAVARTVALKLNDQLSVRDFGAVGDGATDDTAAVQAALNAMITLGGTLWFPPGKYKITTGLTLDLSAITIGQLTHVNLYGTMGASQLYFTPSSGTCLTIKGAQPNDLNTFCVVQGLQLLGTQTSVTEGLALQDTAALTLRDVVIETFGLGIGGTDLLQSTLENCVVGNCGGGAVFLYTNYSPPNAIVFHGCDFVSNLNFGVTLDDPATCTFFGGAVQGNGIGGSATDRYGVGVFCNRSVPQPGAASASFYGVYFEGNKGDADIWYTCGSGTDGVSSVACFGCTFQRISATNYVTNNVRMDIGPPNISKLTLIGNGFAPFNTYVEDISRKYVLLNVSGGAVYDVCDLGNLYQYAVARPVYIGPMKTRRAMASASVTFDGTTTPPTIATSYNVASVTRSSAGNFLITFEMAGNASQYPVAINLNGAGFGVINTPATGSVSIQTMNTASTLTNFSFVSVVVLGNGENT